MTIEDEGESVACEDGGRLPAISTALTCHDLVERRAEYR
jgi:hypothetical protein